MVGDDGEEVRSNGTKRGAEEVSQRERNKTMIYIYINLYIKLNINSKYFVYCLPRLVTMLAMRSVRRAVAVARVLPRFSWHNKCTHIKTNGQWWWWWWWWWW